MGNSKIFLVLIGLFAMACDFTRVKHNAAKKVASNALIKMSSVGITAISGKAGGSVYSRNRGGEYFKNFVMPTNTITAARQAIRAQFGALASGWRSLTQTQRNSWIEGAAAYPRTNPFGDQKILQPNALFVGQNQNLLYADVDMISSIGAPEGTIGVISQETAPVFDIGAGDVFSIDYNLESTNDGPDNEYVLEATPAHSASIKNVENQYRKLATSAADGITPAGTQLDSAAFSSADDLIGAYEAKFGEPSEGDIVSFRMHAVNPNTGEKSAYWYDSVEVTST